MTPPLCPVCGETMQRISDLDGHVECRTGDCPLFDLALIESSFAHYPVRVEWGVRPTEDERRAHPDEWARNESWLMASEEAAREAAAEEGVPVVRRIVGEWMESRS